MLIFSSPSGSIFHNGISNLSHSFFIKQFQKSQISIVNFCFQITNFSFHCSRFFSCFVRNRKFLNVESFIFSPSDFNFSHAILRVAIDCRFFQEFWSNFENSFHLVSFWYLILIPTTSFNSRSNFLKFECIKYIGKFFISFR